MGGPAWLTDIFAAVMITVAAYCTSRLVVARWWRRPTDVDSDGAHVVMGVAMAGMLVTGLRFGSRPASGRRSSPRPTGWFGWRFLRVRRGAPLSQWRCPQPGPHLVECGAMVYMYLAVPAVAAAAKGADGRMPATGARFSVLALVLALFMFGYVARVGERLTVRAPVLAGAVPAASRPEASGALMTATGPEPAAAASPGGCGGGSHGRPYLAPRCAAMCKIAMGITMGYVLIRCLAGELVPAFLDGRTQRGVAGQRLTGDRGPGPRLRRRRSR